MRIPYLDKLYSTVFRVKVQKEAIRPDIAQMLLTAAHEDITTVFTTLDSSSHGLTTEQSDRLLDSFGYNTIVREKRHSAVIRFARTFYNPLIILLLFLAALSFVTGDAATTMIISTMILVSSGIAFYQENQAYNAAESLRSMVKTTCTVLRDGKLQEINLGRLVPGDVVHLSAGDIVPADVRLIASKDLFVNQSLLTGEALPVEKYVPAEPKRVTEPLEARNLCFMGTNVASGTARAIILATGNQTYFGSLAQSIAGERVKTSFDKGIQHFTWLMIRFMLIMVPLVFVINGLDKHNWLDAFLFAVSIAVGLTPAMLPAIVSVNLSKGAIVMAKKNVIVKRLSSIQNFGAMDILCTDKTGTLTQNKVTLIHALDINGKEDETVFHAAYINSFYQTGFKNLLDDAVLNHHKTIHGSKTWHDVKKIDELPFDFERRRLSVVVSDAHGHHTLICKGAVEEVLEISSHVSLHGTIHANSPALITQIKTLSNTLSQEGFRVVAVARRTLPEAKQYYGKNEESELTFLGLMTFLDPPKKTAAEAIRLLHTHGVDVKVLTGDNELVTQKICHDVKLSVQGVLLGSVIETMSDEALQAAAEHTTIFAKLSPDHKRRVVNAIQKNNHVVGFLGDGINDAPALRAADVGISVNTGVDIAKESADIILLEQSLLTLEAGVVEGRKIFANIIKYIKMGASSNFGNMFSVLGASIFLPFLPMTPLQLLTNNLLYDLSQTTIPTDRVDPEYIRKPRQWQIKDIQRFMLYMGPISSLFDYVTFAMMLWVFHAGNNPALFQTGWFIESLLTQTLIVHIIRSRRIPFLQTRASKQLTLTTFTIMALGILIVVSPLGHYLGFVALPHLFWPLLIIILFSYICLTQIVKTGYIKRFGYH